MAKPDGINSGKRIQTNGKRLSKGTVDNYLFVHHIIESFEKFNESQVLIPDCKNLSKREFKTVSNYWKKFYKSFTDYLYNTCGYYDNTVCSIVKIIRTFFKYLNDEKHIQTGNFYKKFYVRTEEIPIITLSPERLNFLIYNLEFQNNLTRLQKQVKDIFNFGCTVALRYSDLMLITKQHIVNLNENYYLKIQSKKTGTFTKIKLPGYAISIVQKYLKTQKKYLFPTLYLNTFNSNLKRIGESCGWTEPIVVYRNARGKVSVKNNCRFCDLMSSHLMRRTAISNMLIMGMPESIVRKISGHAANSSEFYRYVKYSQEFFDEKTDDFFSKIEGEKSQKN